MLQKTDKQIYSLIKKEEKRQQEKLVLIPSENYTSLAVRQALGSVLTHKYSEGEPGKRYYQGNEFVDQIEKLANCRALKVFALSEKKWHVNLKAVSASIANLAVITGVLEPGEKIMAMDLTHGGHLSHGWKLPSGKSVSFSSKIFKVCFYGVEKKTQVFNYDKILKLAKQEKPKLLISGGTAYPREINHKKMAAIAHQVGALYLADIAHEAGLVAAQVNKSPFPWADVVTMSTQKTLRGPRGAIIICKKELAKQIDRAIFPSLQGGPFNHVIAAIAVCLKEANTAKFKNYQKQVIKNARVLADELKKYGFHLVSGGTDKHLILIDLRGPTCRDAIYRVSKKRGDAINGVSTKHGLDGHTAAVLLDKAGLVTNKNTVPFETGSAVKPSGIRIGTPAVTSRGMREKEMKQITKWIFEILIENKNPASVLREVKRMTKNF